MTSAPKPRIAISIGDANGIGPEIALKAAAGFDGSSAAQAVLVGDRFVLEHYREALGVTKPLVDFRQADADRDIAAALTDPRPLHHDPAPRSVRQAARELTHTLDHLERAVAAAR